MCQFVSNWLCENGSVCQRVYCVCTVCISMCYLVFCVSKFFCVFSVFCAYFVCALRVRALCVLCVGPRVCPCVYYVAFESVCECVCVSVCMSVRVSVCV